MNVRIPLSVALAFALAGAALAPTAGAAPPKSNMGFRVGTSFPVRPGMAGTYVLTMPGFPGQGDVADVASSPPCSDGGTVRTDGVIDSLDLLCEFWTSRQGGMTLGRFVAASGTWQHRSILLDPATGDVIVSGDWLDPLGSGEALVVTVSGPPGMALANDTVIVGSHDPSLACPAYQEFALYNVYYHSMFRSANELICGLKDIDWQDADADGNPDTCPNGLFDPSLGGSVEVKALDDPRAGSGAVISRIVVADPSSPTGMTFSGPDFPLSIPDGCLVMRSPEQGTVNACQPHF